MLFPWASGQVTICKAAKKTRSCKSGLEGENYFLRVAYCEGLREEEKNWKLMSCEMIEMEGDIQKC